MRVNVCAAVLFFAIAQPALAASASPEIDCMLVKNDARDGAEAARSGLSLEQGLVHLAASYKITDEGLVKRKLKPTSLATKTQAKMSFTDGYNEAIRDPNHTVKQIAAEAYLSCTFAKNK